jgi:hypothetical protein
MGCDQSPPPRASQHQRPHPPVPKRTRERPPFAGLTTKPLRRLCAYQRPVPTRPYSPASRIVMTRGRSRQIDESATQGHVHPVLCSAHLAIRSVLSVRTYTEGRGETSVLQERVSLSTWVDMEKRADAPRFVPDQRCTMQASRRAFDCVEARHPALYGASCLTLFRGTRWPGEQGQSGGEAHQALPVHAGHGGTAAHTHRGVLFSRSLSNIIHTPASPSTAKLQNIGRPISTETPHALHASPSMADACRRGRECPWCVESLVLTAPGEVCQDACTL